MVELHVLRLGLRPYQEVWELQRRLQQELIEGGKKNTLLLCEHPPTVTLGRSAKTDNVLVDRGELEKRGIVYCEIERGGDVTFHNPKQLVAYPILNLREFKTDVGWYLRALEEVVIGACAAIEIDAQRIAGKTGVWTAPNKRSCANRSSACEPEPRKLASIGVRISRWCTLHGLALNVANDLAGFEVINPCGFPAHVMSSLERELGREVDFRGVENQIVREFCKTFDCHENAVSSQNPAHKV